MSLELFSWYREVGWQAETWGSKSPVRRVYPEKLWGRKHVEGRVGSSPGKELGLRICRPWLLIVGSLGWKGEPRPAHISATG